MGFRLVDDDLAMSFDISLTIHAWPVQSLRFQPTVEAASKTRFELPLGHQLQHLIDADLRPRSERQIAYALGIAKALDIPLHGEVRQVLAGGAQ
jgi:hypothetical protein